MKNEKKAKQLRLAKHFSRPKQRGSQFWMHLGIKIMFLI